MHIYKYNNNYICANNQEVANNIYCNLIHISEQELKEREKEKKNKKLIKQQEKQQEKQEIKIKKKIEEINNYYNQVIEGYVYVISCNGYCKIGKSKNPDKRIESLKTGTPYHLDIIQIFKSKNMNVLERLLHNIFKNKRIKREWFNLDDKDIGIILDKKFDDIICSYIDPIYEFERKLRIPDIYTNVI